MKHKFINVKTGVAFQMTEAGKKQLMTTKNFNIKYEYLGESNDPDPKAVNYEDSEKIKAQFEADRIKKAQQIADKRIIDEKIAAQKIADRKEVEEKIHNPKK